MSGPSIVFVTGSFCLPSAYDNVINPIAAKGFDIRAIHLPTVGPREGTPPTMYDDAALISQEVSKLADEGKDVVLFGHSYGGIPVSESVKGLSREERQKQGKSGGIVRLAYMTALVPPIGIAAAETLADVPKETQLKLKTDEKGWMYHDPVAASAGIVVSDLPLEEAEQWVIKNLAQHSAVSFTNELTYAGYKDVPVSYLLCEDDLCIPAKNQRAGIDVIEESGRKVDITSIRSGHCPSVTHQQETIDWILDVVTKA